MAGDGTSSRPPLSDTAMEVGMGRLLQVGVLLASATVLVGGVLLLWAGGERVVSYRTFAGEPGALRNWADLLRGAAHGEAAAVIQVGVLLLIATPVARVVFALVAFALKRDRLYVGVSLLVLTILLVELFWVG